MIQTWKIKILHMFKDHTQYFLAGVIRNTWVHKFICCMRFCRLYIYNCYFWHAEDLEHSFTNKTIEIGQELNSQMTYFHQFFYTLLLPSLEQVTKVCLSERYLKQQKNCTVGDLMCAEINLLSRRVDCLMCVDGELIPTTDNGSPNYCTHYVSLKNAGLNATVENSKLRFTIINDLISGNISAPLTNHHVHQEKECQCSWAFYYLNVSIATEIRDDLMFCNSSNCSNPERWFCLNKKNVVKCFQPIATCTIHDGTSVRCSLQDDLNNYRVRAKSCASNLIPGIKGCNFMWPLRPSLISTDGNEVFFNVQWNEEIRNDIQNFTCYNSDNKEVCSDGIPTCTSTYGDKEYCYSFFTCALNSTTIPSPPPQPTLPNHNINGDTGDNDDNKSTATIWLFLIIVVLVVAFLSYVVYQNYQKVSDYMHAL